MITTLPCLINGQQGHEATLLNQNNRGFTSADGLIETMRFEQNSIPLWSLHKQRLLKGLALLNIKLTETALEQEKTHFLQLCPLATARIRLTVTRAAGNRVTFSSTNQAATLWQCTPLAEHTEPHRVGWIPEALSAPSKLAGLKSINRLEYILAAQHAQTQGWSEILLGSSLGQLVEGVHHNLWLYLNETWVTPDVSQCGVAGVARAFLLSQSPFFKIQHISIEQLHAASALALSNAVQGVNAISHFNNKEYDLEPINQLKIHWENRLQYALDS